MSKQQEESSVPNREAVLRAINLDKRNLAYRRARAGLIPEAERYANEKHGPKPKRKRGAVASSDQEMKEWGDNWTASFLRRMHYLAVQSGLERCGRCKPGGVCSEFDS